MSTPEERSIKVRRPSTAVVGRNVLGVGVFIYISSGLVFLSASSATRSSGMTVESISICDASPCRVDDVRLLPCTASLPMSFAAFHEGDQRYDEFSIKVPAKYGSESWVVS